MKQITILFVCHIAICLTVGLLSIRNDLRRIPLNQDHAKNRIEDAKTLTPDSEEPGKNTYYIGGPVLLYFITGLVTLGVCVVIEMVRKNN